MLGLLSSVCEHRPALGEAGREREREREKVGGVCGGPRWQRGRARGRAAARE
eukprot:COSAG03_NODE_167_length_11280_cov_8.065468_3_plen_52_part_00